jgi:hypothetical protein
MDSRVAVHESFDALPAPYQSLFLQAAQEAGLFFSLPWFANLAGTAFAARRVRIYAVENPRAEGETGAVRLALPLAWESNAGSIGKMRELAACANYYSSLFGPVVAAGHDHTAVQRDMTMLAQTIAGEMPAWHMVRLQPMDADAAMFNACVAAFRQAGMAVQPYFCFGNWYLQVNGRSYQEYVQSLPSRLRNTLARKTRQLEASRQSRILIIKDGPDIETGIAAFERVYRSSWKPVEAHPAFIAGLIRMGAQQGWLRLGVAYVDDEPAAAQLWIVCHGVASIYKLAYDQRFADLSIGSILTARLMEHVIDVDRVKEVDYLTGDDDYKRDWMSHRRERWGMVAFNLRTAHGLLAAARHIGGRSLKSWWQRARRSN